MRNRVDPICCVKRRRLFLHRNRRPRFGQHRRLQPVHAQAHRLQPPAQLRIGPQQRDQQEIAGHGGFARDLERAEPVASDKATRVAR